MKDWQEILDNPVSHEIAKTLALDEYKKYKIIQDQEYISDFDKQVTEDFSVTANDGTNRNHHEYGRKELETDLKKLNNQL